MPGTLVPHVGSEGTLTENPGTGGVLTGQRQLSGDWSVTGDLAVTGDVTAATTTITGALSAATASTTGALSAGTTLSAAGNASLSGDKLTLDNGDTKVDPSVFSAANLAISRTLDEAGGAGAGSANSWGATIQADIPVTGAAAHYEKAALMAIARTVDPSVVPTINRDCVGAHIQGYSRTTMDSRVWGANIIGQIDTGDGQIVGIELDVINNAAADVSSMTGGTHVKNALAIVASGSQNSTCGINLTISGTAKWHKGLYADPNALFADSSTFLELDGRFVVNKVGAITVTRALSSDAAAAFQVTGDTFARYRLDLAPGLQLGPGSSAAAQVLTTRRTGWGAPTGTATRTTFATSTVTLPQLAERVKALIDDLTTHGMIGA